MDHDLDGNTTETKGRPVALERFIHTGIYSARPDVRAVVHTHTPSLVMFSSSNIQLRPVFAGAGFIGSGVPAFKNGDAGGSVNNADVGRRLAGSMGTTGVPTLVALPPRGRAR